MAVNLALNALFAHVSTAGTTPTRPKDQRRLPELQTEGQMHGERWRPESAGVSERARPRSEVR